MYVYSVALSENRSVTFIEDHVTESVETVGDYQLTTDAPLRTRKNKKNKNKIKTKIVLKRSFETSISSVNFLKAKIKIWKRLTLTKILSKR